MKLIIALLFAAIVTIRADPTAGCWLSAYGRGVGQAISACGEGEEKDGLLCYPVCESGYTGVGPVCWQTCPDDFTDTGLDCLKPSSYGRGAGYALWDEGKCNDENPQGCEKSGLLWYPNCKDGFHAVGCCVCSPDCPDGMDDIGVSCAKASYGRTAGTPLGCPEGQDEDASLCYEQCSAGYHGVGPVCWGSCPTGYNECGALCIEGESCSGDIAELGEEGLEGVEQAAEDAGANNTAGIVETSLETVAKIGAQLFYPICDQ